MDLIEIKRPVFDNSIEPFDLAKLEGKNLIKISFLMNLSYGQISIRLNAK